jgi:hypothetical protein
MNKIGKRGLWIILGVVLVVLLVVAMFLYIALKGPDYSSRYTEGTQILENPTKGLSLEEAIDRFDESFVYYLMVSVEAYNLHNPPLSKSRPRMLVLVGEDIYTVVINKGDIEVVKGEEGGGEDIIFRTTTEEAVMMIQNRVYIEESFRQGRSRLETKESKSTLFAKGYLGLYQDLTGSSLTGNVAKIYFD